ncbi:MAG: hypothetical protein EXS50_02270 [Candidatus Taylorbacteria bacterium]|nr:hypothetical protein [Candidatus Taylorbacteria bacterium]
MNNTTLAQILKYFGLGNLVNCTQYLKGMVNLTYIVTTDSGTYIVQRLSTIFNDRVIEDHFEVASFLMSQGFIAPELIKTPSGSLSMRKDGFLWKVCKYISHDPKSSPTVGSITSAAALLGRFHRVMEGCRYVPQYLIPDFHHTRKIIAKLSRVFKDHSRVESVEQYAVLADYFLSKYIESKTRHYPTYDDEPPILIHGDPKFDNFLFENDRAVALIDFDTVMRSDRLVDIGDGFGSWCRKNSTEFDRHLFVQALEAYNSESRVKVLETDAKSAVSHIALELGARFLIDCFEESYFEWDSSKYKNRAEHNFARANRMFFYHQNIMKA